MPLQRPPGVRALATALPRQRLLWRLFVPNALILVLAVGLLALLPVTVSFPVRVGEVAILAGAAALMLGVNLLLTRRVLAPLLRLREAMRTVDPLRPGPRIAVGARSIEVAELAAAFDDMLDRLELERRTSARRAQRVQEEERRAISLELHDEVGQNLTALLLQLDVLDRAATPEQHEALEAALATVRDTLERIRALVRGLRPETLDDLGLSRALNHLCDRVAAESGLEVSCTVDRGLPRLGAEADLAVYRIAQESLTNVMRHAGAQRADVSLAPRDGGVRLAVADDGSGLPAGSEEGYGVRGMRERALLLGARLSLDSGPAGTRVTVDIPAEALSA